MSKLQDWPEEDAVILQDIGELRVTEGNSAYEIQIERYVRLKVLTQAGSRYGNLQLPYLTRDNRESIYALEGRVHYRNETGEVEVEPMGKVFREEVRPGLSVLRTAFGKVGAGAVIEYKYKQRIKYIFSYTWNFQRDLPVLYSEFRARFVEQTGYAFVFEGSYSDKLQKLGPQNSSHWVMRDLPALRPEPFIRNLEDYRSKMVMQMTAIYSPRQRRVIETLSSWEALTEDVYRENRLGRFDKRHRNLRDLADRIAPPDLPAAERLRLLHTHVRDRMRWDGRYRIFTDEKVDDLYEAQRGSSAEINLVLLHLLRQAGFKADPVLLSTQAHGQPVKVYPIFDQFNALALRVMLEGKPTFVDASHALLPLELLPQDYLNTEGWLLNRDQPGWVDITGKQESNQQIFLQTEVQPSGQLAVTLSHKTQGYPAADLRRQFFELGEEAFIRQQLSALFNDFALTDFSVSEAESLEKPFSFWATFTTQDFIQSAGDRLYVQPLMAWALQENPFEEEIRTYPIQFPYQREDAMTINIDLPSGWTVEELPQSHRLSLPNRDMSFQYICDKVGSNLQIQNTLSMDRATFPSDSYPALRQYYTELAKRQAQPLVLRRE